MCRVLGVSKAGYYAWRDRRVSLRAQNDADLSLRIVDIHKRSRSTYGSPRIHAELRSGGVRCSRKRVARLMKIVNVYGKTRGKRYRQAVMGKNDPSFSPNVLNRNFRVDYPNKVWVADITYLPIRGQWLYLAVVLDLYSRLVVGWATATDLKGDVARRALTMAIRNRKPARGIIHHSDRGVQYVCDHYQRLLVENGIISSMSRRRDCWDNAVAESFFGTLKAEVLPPRGWPDRLSADRAISEWIEVFYNRVRRHSHNNYISPAAAEENLDAA